MLPRRWIARRELLREALAKEEKAKRRPGEKIQPICREVGRSPVGLCFSCDGRAGPGVPARTGRPPHLLNSCTNLRFRTLAAFASAGILMHAELLDLTGLKGIFGRNAIQNRAEETTVSIDGGPVALGNGFFH